MGVDVEAVFVTAQGATWSLTEVLVELAALGTGHRGSMASVHADDPASALRRLELLVAASGSTSSELVRSQIGSVIDIILHVERLRSGRREVVAVGELTRSGLSACVGEVGKW